MPQKVDAKLLHAICDRAFYQALKMIQFANARPHEKGEPKTGGHASACASSQHILAALHLFSRNPEDYIACKPHVSPIDHAFNFLLHNFREKDGSRMPLDRRVTAMGNLRHYSKDEPVFQSYHAEADPDGYRYFPSGSVGIPPVTALYTALAYDFVGDHGFELNEKPYFWNLMGDSEFREGSLAEAMPDAGERELDQVVWIVDYNRQNLDGTRISNEEALDGSDADRMIRIAEANGWFAIKLKHGKLREKLFKKTGGQELQRVLDEEFSDHEFQGLIAANNPKLTREVLSKKSKKLATWLKPMSDDDLHAAFTNLGGHDIESLIEAYQAAKKSKKPTFIVAYTVKGKGLRCQALSGNHSTLPEDDELKEMAEKLGVDDENPFVNFDDGSKEEKFLVGRRKDLVEGIDEIVATVKDRKERWLETARSLDWTGDLDITAIKFNPMAHTQWMWGQIAAKLDRLARGERLKEGDDKEKTWSTVAPHFLTMAPDVGTSTNTSPNMNGKLYGDTGQKDFEKIYNAKDTRAPDILPHLNERTGHIRFEIAEGNCMSAAGAFGKFFDYVGIPLYPAMTIYDFFIKRCHDQYYYNLYWKSHFATIGTPSGVTLAPEGAQHSWKSDFQIPNCITWEPCFAKELEWIFADMLRRHFTAEDEDREAMLLRCVTKGVPQKELSARLKTQKRFEGQSEEQIFSVIREEVLEGAYPIIHYQGYDDYSPGDNVVHIFAMGALGIEAIKASDLLRKKGIFANVFLVTSPDLLLGNYGYNNDYNHLRNTLGVTGTLYFDAADEVASPSQWYALQGSRIPVVSVHDGEPGLLDNIGAVVGVQQEALAVRKTSKSGTTKDIFKLHGIDGESVAEAAERVLKQTAKEEVRVSAALLESVGKADLYHRG